MIIPIWMKIAKGEIGQHEIRGGENPRIIEYDAATTLKAQEDEVAWCSAFVNWCMQKVGFKGTRSAAALSWLEWGKSIMVEPQVGAIVVFDWGNGHGHVGFLSDWDDNLNRVSVLGGNQADSVCYAWFNWDQVADMRWPKFSKVEMVEE